ncbi:proximal tubules-expressed gene protein isoform X4 [Oryzias latipes]|uniref:proximal tubules-expressed gene protein isoform X4 n=1 Tax=Oryzias latipes TaxID=8090 RepID=UPI0000E9DF4E|nr:proximal tubules-expressed gene protein isoform X4 [Oryzias latipes]
MGPLLPLVSSLLLVVGSVGAQTGLPKYERLLPQWLTGIIAVSGFLLLTFIAFVVKKVWCEKSSRRRNSRDSETAPAVNHYDMSLRGVRRKSSTDENTYEACEASTDERRRDDHGEYENVKSKGHKDKATAM